MFVYPNAGGRWDAERKVWETPPARIEWGQAVLQWQARGAFGIGGCCRVRPDDIAAIRQTLARRESGPSLGQIG